MGVDLIKPGEVRTKHFHPPMNVALATPLIVFGGVLVILLIARIFIRLQHRRRLRRSIDSDDQECLSKNGALLAGLNRHVFYAPFLSTRHSREFRLLGRIHMGIAPLRLESILLVGYLGLNLIFFFVLIDWWKDYEEVMFQLKYSAGHLAVMNSPVLVLTAGRNNPLIWMLGISFDTFNLLHRWVGRLMIVGAIVHMACVVASDATKSKSSTNPGRLKHTGEEYG